MLLLRPTSNLNNHKQKSNTSALKSGDVVHFHIFISLLKPAAITQVICMHRETEEDRNISAPHGDNEPAVNHGSHKEQQDSAEDSEEVASQHLKPRKVLDI